MIDFGRLYNGDMIKALNNMVEAHKQVYHRIHQIERDAGHAPAAHHERVAPAPGRPR